MKFMYPNYNYCKKRKIRVTKNFTHFKGLNKTKKLFFFFVTNARIVLYVYNS